MLHIAGIGFVDLCKMYLSVTDTKSTVLCHWDAHINDCNNATKHSDSVLKLILYS